MKRFPLLLSFALLASACSDDPTGPEGARGTLDLPGGTVAAVLEFTSADPIAAVWIGYGEEEERLASGLGTTRVRVLLLGQGSLPTRLPVRVQSASPAEGLIVEVADAAGKVDEPATLFPVR